MIDASRVQELFYAICFHLNSESYDFFTYNGKVKNKKPTYYSDKLARKLETEANVVEFFLANQIAYFFENQKVNTWIGAFANKESVHIWEKFVAERESRSYRLLEESKILLSLGQDLKDFSKIYPLILQKKLSVPVICNFMVRFKLYKIWQTNDPLLDEILRFLRRISLFYIMQKENFDKTILKAKEEL